ncbi:chromosome segregation protein SMC [Naumannella halotolerans]|uniref:chromosome segregation protein SMC n=1 Tax=Naumannella halotolerans TaxID=993414 RepID=UPI00370D3AED
MYLKSLTLRGFKSFASATALHFEPGITCVVGPNGSGKSNVVDALSWVMGEQGAKSLRGGKMEDVIFAGTSGRAPLGRAEVELTIDNTDGALPIDYTEVTIKRTMFRSGGSDYQINGQNARLLDVQELLSDSGIGREMHVIVGQGQLDSILQATPEGRRGFVEEAAGVLKHRKRREKAVRKLESTEGNLHRLNDLLEEVRRQLKPLGRQAAVARKAAVIQAEVRDARARLLADDLVQAEFAMASDLADEAAARQERARLEAALEEARNAEAEAEEQLRLGRPRLAAAQEAWYDLSALRERVSTTSSIARERVRNAAGAAEPATPTGRDPDELERQAESVAAQERQLAEEVAGADAALKDATLARTDAEAAHAAEEKRYASLVRAAADRREGLARLQGQVASLSSRLEAADAELGRLAEVRADALARAEKAKNEFRSVEAEVAKMSAGEEGLDAEHEEATAALTEIESQIAELDRTERAAGSEKAAAQARVEALRLGLDRKDAGAALLAAADKLDGVRGALASLITIESGYEKAVSAALGAAADAIGVDDLDAAAAAFQHLKREDLGRATLLLAGPAGDQRAEDLGPLPDGARRALDLITADDDLRPALRRLLGSTVVIDDAEHAQRLLAGRPELTAVTAEGDIYSSWFAAGGSQSKQSLIEAQSAVDDAEAALTEAGHALDRVKFARPELDARRAEAAERVEAALDRLHASDAEMAAVAEQLGRLGAVSRSAGEEADRAGRSIEAAENSREQNSTALAELRQRLELASAEAEDVEEADPAERDRLGELARAARTAEMESRLALRTVEERARGLAGRSDSLRRAAQSERASRARAEERRRALLREAEVAAAVETACGWIARQVEIAREAAAAERSAAEREHAEADTVVGQARQRSREFAAELEKLVDAVHRDELARAQQRMRVEALQTKALEELGIEAATLAAEYGPDQPVPVLTRPDGSALTEDDEQPEPVPFVRDEQSKRLRSAERALNQLGKVNPLALEEFDAMQERHAFLAEQLDDLRKTRADLAEIIDEVDARVQQVFTEAYADVETAFSRVFARLFPGGEGRLVLTDPNDMLTTGIDVEARPPGKKVKRLSLLSGGERSLVAVAFLVALFIARPSPFYILDEVEAALDDTNLGRLLELYEELRENSQLLVITHQKRTMEIADALYGVTMRGDGVSMVISQRLDKSA